MTHRDHVDYELTVGDFGKVLTAVLEGADKEPVNLTQATSITMRLGREGQPPVATGAATKNPDQTGFTGYVTYTWAAGDTDQAGEFEMVFVVVFPGARLTFPTHPLRVRIQRELVA